MKYAKGGDVRVASYAHGGPVLGRSTDFMKTPDSFRTNVQPSNYTKKGSVSGKDKSLPAVKPRS
jgi:hypothetical protein